ncbi:MAG: hypothetical protein IIZ13_04755 [Renibacterium sp.]|nr:hypothetical protein [Renibacterium sp.]
MAKFRRYGFIFIGPGLTGQETVIEHGDFKQFTVGVSDTADAPKVALKMVEDGVQLLDLCGAFGPVEAAKVIEAIDGRIPVGHASYGIGSSAAVLALDE